MNEPDSFDHFSSTDDVRANLKRKSIRGAAFMAFGNAADILVRFGSIAVLARLLLPEDFGLIFMVWALMGILDGLRDFGLSAATVQRADISHRQVTNLFWLNVAVGAFLASIFALAAPLIAAFYEEGRLVDITVGFSLVYVLHGLAVQHEALLIRQLRQGELALIRLAASVISVAVAIWLALNGWGYWSLVWREIVRSAIIAGGVWLRCLWIPGLPRRNMGTRSLVRFGGEISVTNFLNNLTIHVDRLLVGALFGAVPVGLYRQAQQLIQAPIEQLNSPIVWVTQPALSALQKDPVRYRKYYEKIIFIVGSLTIPLGFFIAVCAEDITLLMLGPNWTEASIFVRIFGAGAAIRPIIMTSGTVLLTCGQSTRYLALTIVHTILLVLVLVAAIPWGPEGIAIAYLGTTLALMIPRLYFSFVNTPPSVLGFFNTIRPPLVSTLVMVGSLLAVRSFASTDGFVASLAISIGVGGAAYLASLWLQPSGRAEMRSLVVDVRSALKARQS